MEKEGSSAAYGEFLTGVGAGKIDPGVARVGLSFLLNHPTPDLEKLISDRIPSGTAQGKKLLEGAKREIDTRRELGAKLARVPGVEKELAKGDQSGLGYFAESAFLENAPTRAVREIAEKRYRIVVPEGAGDAADAAMRVETLNALKDRQLRRIVTAPAAGGR
jgi:hypothetical protein